MLSKIKAYLRDRRARRIDRTWTEPQAIAVARGRGAW